MSTNDSSNRRGFGKGAGNESWQGHRDERDEQWRQDPRAYDPRRAEADPRVNRQGDQRPRSSFSNAYSNYSAPPQRAEPAPPPPPAFPPASRFDPPQRNFEPAPQPRFDPEPRPLDPV